MKFINLLALSLFISAIAYAQQTDTTKIEQQTAENKLQKPKLDKSRIYYGGYVTMNFSKNYSVFGAQPMVAYKLTPELSVGAQFSFDYINDKRYSFEQNGSNYGFSIFSRYRVVPRLYAHTELSMMSYKWFYDDSTADRKWAPIIYIGGGYSQPISNNVYLNAQVLFDVLNHKNSPHKDWKPYYSLGIGVGF